MLSYGIPFAIYDASQGAYITLTDALYANKLDTLLNERNITLALQPTQNEFNLSLKVTGGNVIPVDNLIKLLPTITTNPNAPQASLAKRSIEALARKLGTTYESFLTTLRRADMEVSILQGRLAPIRKLPLPRNMFVEAIVNKINEKYFPATISKSTVKMENPSDDVVLALPYPEDVVISNYTLPNLSQLYSVPEELATSKWKTVAKELGIPPEYVAGNDDNNKGGIHQNEMLLYKNLQSIYAECVKAEFNVTSDDPKFLSMRPKSFKKFMEDMLYIVLRHNWQHTIRIPKVDATESLMDDDDNGFEYDEDDNSGTNAARDLTAFDYTFDYTDEDIADTLVKLRKLRIIDTSITNIPDGRKFLFDFLEFLDSKKPNPYYPIEAFIKLLRWGNRKPSKLYLGDFDTHYFDMDTFQVKEEFNEEESKVVSFYGHNLLPKNVVVLPISTSITIKELYNIPKDVAMIIPGVFCTKTYQSKSNPDKRLYKTYYMDALNILETYRNHDTENFIYGIKYEGGKFSAINEEYERLFRAARSDVAEGQTYSIYTFTPTLADSVYQLPELLIDDFLNTEVPNKKMELHLPGLMMGLEEADLSTLPDHIQYWLPKAAYIYKQLINQDKDNVDLITFLNAIANLEGLSAKPEELSARLREHSTSTTSTPSNSDELSNRFSDNSNKTTIHSNQVSNGNQPVQSINLAEEPKVAYSLPIATVNKAYRVVRKDGSLVCYYDVEKKVIVDKKSIVGQLLTDKSFPLDVIIKGYASNAHDNPQIKELLHYLVDEL